MRGLVLMGKPWLSPGGQGRSPDPGVGADWLWGLAESLSLAVSQFPLLRSERVGLSAAQPLGRWCKGWWARPGLKLPAPVGWVARVGLSPVTFLYLSTVKCGKSLPSEALAEKPAVLSFAIRAHILGSPLVVERGGTAGAQGDLVASTSVRAHGGS